MKKMIQIIISIIALAVLAPCHAKEVGKQSDLECLARNIYYEAASESEEGKVAVGLVTINRSNSGNFPKTICGVVNQRTDVSVAKTVTQTRTVTEGMIFRSTKQVRETTTKVVKHTVCQFSWRCENVHAIRKNDARWNDSVMVATVLLDGGYDEFRDKYRDALYFHERHVKPTWAKQKVKIDKVGGHIFYANQRSVPQGLTIAQSEL
jgi:spore germination cell wall hydrolase CwlJ-like protein